MVFNSKPSLLLNITWRYSARELKILPFLSNGYLIHCYLVLGLACSDKYPRKLGRKMLVLFTSLRTEPSIGHPSPSALQHFCCTAQGILLLIQCIFFGLLVRQPNVLSVHVLCQNYFAFWLHQILAKCLTNLPFISACSFLVVFITFLELEVQLVFLIASKLEWPVP